MESLVPFVKYIFVTAVGVEILMILRALFLLARDKARDAQAPTPSAGE